MGAIGGGIAGGFAGNKLGNHGILGALAGAYMGHKAEEWGKNRHHQGQGGGSQYGGSSGW